MKNFFLIIAIILLLALKWNFATDRRSMRKPTANTATNAGRERTATATATATGVKRTSTTRKRTTTAKGPKAAKKEEEQNATVSHRRESHRRGLSHCPKPTVPRQEAGELATVDASSLLGAPNSTTRKKSLHIGKAMGREKSGQKHSKMKSKKKKKNKKGKKFVPKNEIIEQGIYKDLLGDSPKLPKFKSQPSKVAWTSTLDDYIPFLDTIEMDVGDVEVRRARHTYNRMECAVKIVRVACKSVCVQLLNEILVHIELPPHENVVKMYHAFVEEVTFTNGSVGMAVCVVFEYLNGGDLSDAMDEGKLSEKEIRPIMRDFIEGLVHFHRNGFVHRDIKTGNLMLHKDRKTKRLYGKVIDTGLAKKANAPDGIDFWPCGTTSYFSPESVLLKHQDEGSDFWALGVSLWFFLNPDDCFYDPQDYFDALYDNASDVGELKKTMLAEIKDVYFPMPITPSGKEFLRGLLKFDWRRRTRTREKALSASWFNDAHFKPEFEALGASPAA